MKNIVQELKWYDLPQVLQDQYMAEVLPHQNSHKPLDYLQSKKFYPALIEWAQEAGYDINQPILVTVDY